MKWMILLIAFSGYSYAEMMPKTADEWERQQEEKQVQQMEAHDKKPASTIKREIEDEPISTGTGTSTEDDDDGKKKKKGQ